MVEWIPETRSARMLAIYTRLVGGEILQKQNLALEYHVSPRSIQRDIETLRSYLAEQGLSQEVILDRGEHGYRLQNCRSQNLSNDEILAVCKILLESRSMRRDEMQQILEKLVACCVPLRSREAVRELIANELFHYIPPHHNKPILQGLWQIGQAVRERRVMEIEYERMKEPRYVWRRVQPVGLMFSEYYFYLTAYLEDKTTFDNPDDIFPTIYRIDRIRSFKILDERFLVPYAKRFEEGEFRKRVQFMYPGRLQTICFHYSGPSIEAVLDRLPTAEVIDRDETGWSIRAEVFGKGAEMWLRQQGDYITDIKECVST